MTTESRFGTELVTFYHPAFWNTANSAEMLDYCSRHPDLMWETILTSLVDAGVDSFEMTVPPAGPQSVLDAFGSADSFAGELASRGLSLNSGFYFILDWPHEAEPATALDSLSEYAGFVAASGGDTVVLGPAMRRDRNDPDPLFVDLQYMKDLADLLNRAGQALLAQGVTLTVHNEAHSILSHERDIDLLMLLTDPEYVSLCLDFGNLTVAGGDPVPTATRHRSRIAAAHWKDAVGAMPRSTRIDETIHDRHRDYFCEVGSGRVDWQALGAILTGTRAEAPIIFVLDAAPDPVPAIRRAREYLTTVLPS